MPDHDRRSNRRTDLSPRGTTGARSAGTEASLILRDALNPANTNGTTSVSTVLVAKSATRDPERTDEENAMPRETVPLYTDDLSRFARALAGELGDAAPSHQSLLNMLARSAGYRNHQHLRADAKARQRLDQPPAPAPVVDHKLVERALNHFDDDGLLVRWPTRNAVQKLVVWVFWADLAPGERVHEAEINERFTAGHRFDDPATIRRMLVGLGRVERERDGSAYTRVEEPLPGEAQELVRRVRARRSARISPTS